MGCSGDATDAWSVTRIEPTSPPRLASHAWRSLATWLVGLAIFVGLPLLSWGPDAARAFVGNAARTGYLVLVVVLNAFAAIRIPEIGKSRPAPVSVVGRQRWAVTLLQLLSLAVVIVGPYCDRRAVGVFSSGALRYIGLGLYTVGFLTMHWAEASLGKQFSLEVAIQQDHELVTDGLYRYVRHPRYLGIATFMTGLSLVFRSELALLLAIASMAVLAWRIHDEELLMGQEFGDRWQAYARRSWRLVPWVY